MKTTQPFFVSFCNEINIGADGWAMIAPFGDFPSPALIPDGKGGMKKVPAIQRIDKAGADAMVADFHNSRRGLRKFLTGCNIYVGHPHVPGLGKFYPDKEPKGVFANLETRADGLYGLPVFTNEGSDLVENADPAKRLRAFSGDLGESEDCGLVDGKPCYRPTKIYSAGLTNTPHLPVHFFNADDTLAEAPNAQADKPTTKNTMKKKLLEICTKLGIQFANEADDAQTEAALTEVESKVAAFANEKEALTQKVTALETDITNLTAQAAAAKTEITAAQTQFANERTERINDELALAITTGKITEAEKPTWQARLQVAAQFANERAALRALSPKIKTTSITLTRGGRTEQVDISDAKSRAQFANEVLVEIANELKLNRIRDHARIYAEAQRRHPALFEGMAFKEIKLPGKK